MHLPQSPFSHERLVSKLKEGIGKKGEIETKNPLPWEATGGIVDGSSQCNLRSTFGSTEVSDPY